MAHQEGTSTTKGLWGTTGRVVGQLLHVLPGEGMLLGMWDAVGMWVLPVGSSLHPRQREERDHEGHRDLLGRRGAGDRWGSGRGLPSLRHGRCAASSCQGNDSPSPLHAPSPTTVKRDPRGCGNAAQQQVLTGSASHWVRGVLCLPTG